MLSIFGKQNDGGRRDQVSHFVLYVSNFDVMFPYIYFYNTPFRPLYIIYNFRHSYIFFCHPRRVVIICSYLTPIDSNSLNIVLRLTSCFNTPRFPLRERLGQWLSLCWKLLLIQRFKLYRREHKRREQKFFKHSCTPTLTQCSNKAHKCTAAHPVQ